MTKVYQTVFTNCLFSFFIFLYFLFASCRATNVNSVVKFPVGQPKSLGAIVNACVCEMVPRYLDTRASATIKLTDVCRYHVTSCHFLRSDLMRICQITVDSGGYCNIGCASETHLKLKFREILFTHNLLLSYQIILKFCTKHGSITAVLCAKLQNDLTNE